MKQFKNDLKLLINNLSRIIYFINNIKLFINFLIYK